MVSGVMLMVRLLQIVLILFWKCDRKELLLSTAKDEEMLSGGLRRYIVENSLIGAICGKSVRILSILY